MYQNLAKTSALIEELWQSEEISNEQVEFYLSIQDSMESVADTSCKAAIGRKESRKLKQAIISF